ncbi:hypothetical protein [Geothermobacter hydrogeniphilus]|uniref:hypothetical protein n=1 Tax=Geothermobacter hydrogeniphilus TaxID=1969733 RepID=UPI001552431F|nr:hypothetical protein [Geothermobacter hydrogeniphilus]
MTFACINYDANDDCCRKLGGECIPGRRGCVLDGQVTLSDELRRRVDELEKKQGKSKD